MELSYKIDNKIWKANLQDPINIGIVIHPSVSNPHVEAFSLPNATANPVTFGDYQLDVLKGSTVNCDTITFCAHGNGTHTECIGHICASPKKLTLFSPEFKQPPLFIPCCFIRVTPIKLSDTLETYNASANAETDTVITAESLKENLSTILDKVEGSWFLQALVVSVNSNCYQFSGTNPPYFTIEAALYLKELGVKHLLVDLPSVDREESGDKVSVHTIFFSSYSNESTITELCNLPQHIQAGRYMLNLNVAPFDSDAAPSKPILFPVKEER